MNIKVQNYTELNPTELELLTEELYNKINDLEICNRIEMSKVIENLDISERLKIWMAIGLGMTVVLEGIKDKELVNEIVNKINVML